MKFRLRPRRKRQMPEAWRPYTQKRKQPRMWQGAVAAALLGGLIGVGSLQLGQGSLQFGSTSSASDASAPAIERHFTLCHTGGGTNCVVDGDTIWLDGVKIRVADIDAPETHPPHCPREAGLGNKATARLRELLNAGPFTVRPGGLRDEDKYGRKLRVLTRDGRSIGDMLVADGLARTWDGKRHPWC